MTHLCPHASLLNLANFDQGTPREEIARLRKTGQRIIWQEDEYANGGHWLVLQRDDIDTVLKTPAAFRPKALTSRQAWSKTVTPMLRVSLMP